MTNISLIQQQLRGAASSVSNIDPVLEFERSFEKCGIKMPMERTRLGRIDEGVYFDKVDQSSIVERDEQEPHDSGAAMVENKDGTSSAQVAQQEMPTEDTFQSLDIDDGRGGSDFSATADDEPTRMLNLQMFINRLPLIGVHFAGESTIVKEGILYRPGRIRKGLWRPAWVVLTRTGFLHCFEARTQDNALSRSSGHLRMLMRMATWNASRDRRDDNIDALLRPHSELELLWTVYLDSNVFVRCVRDTWRSNTIEIMQARDRLPAPRVCGTAGGGRPAIFESDVSCVAQ